MIKQTRLENLPQEIQRKIYEYDSTWREKFSQIVKDLQEHLNDKFKQRLAIEYADYSHSVDRFGDDREWSQNGFIWPIDSADFTDNPFWIADYWYHQYGWQLTDAECRAEGFYDDDGDDEGEDD